MSKRITREGWRIFRPMAGIAIDLSGGQNMLVMIPEGVTARQVAEVVAMLRSLADSLEQQTSEDG